MLKLSVRPEKIETDGRGKALCRQFQIFPAESDSLNILCQYHGFMKLAQKFQLWYKTATFICQFLSETVRQ